MSIVHILQAELELTGPGAVTAPEAHTVASVLRPDLPLARDGWGNPYLPGTSLTGSLRHQTPPDRRRALFGDVFKDPDNTSRNGREETTAIASPVRVLGTRLTLPDTPVTHRRHTAVDRHRAAAKATTLHDRELLPPGTELTLWLRIDSETTVSPLVDEVLELLRGWRPRIGGGRTTGYGRAELITVRHRVIDLSTPAGLHHWLTTGGPGLVDDQATVVHDRAQRAGGAPDEPYVFGRALQFRIADAVHIGTGTSAERSGRRGGVAKILRDHENVPVIPGSTWKGVLRARVEFILRSVGIGDVCASVEDNTSGSCGTCVVCEAFGWSERPGRAANGAEPSKTVGARGRLLFADSPVRGGEVRVRNHVAIDRVFGGARDEALYSEETVEDGHLTLHIRHDKAVPDLIRAALVLALKDLADGAIGIGGGTTRGYGTLTAQPTTADWLTAERTSAMDTLRAHHRPTSPAPAQATEEAPA
ncbi:RAMP superfamily CRISPR-associated protein [Streptomyces yerevanensis]|uniref:RAMP superfamily CRISPR-associated protein n=1 Tax=Streptomyces yerevanensis TaxID=66378 RepID=UPI0005252F74|nr:RAMP superfamily CRISPR-associated protein [Streptomyces yerevanensis]